MGVAEGGGVVEGGDDPVDGRGDEDAVFGGFEHVHAFVVDVGGVVDHVHAGFQGDDDGVAAAGVGADTDVAAVCFV